MRQCELMASGDASNRQTIDLPLQLQEKLALSQRPHHPSQPSTIRVGDETPNDWRGLCENLSDLIVKFLHSMRRL